MNDFIPASVYCNNVFDGTHETPKHVKTGRPFVTSKNIMGRKLDLSTSYNISESDYNSFQVRSKVSQWDVLFSLIGSVGEVYLEKEENIPYAIKNIGVFSCKDEYKAKWLYYYLQSPYAKSHINSYLRGAVQKFLSLGLLREFPIPPYDKSKNKIIDCLFDLDAKIELNQRINAELESMAKTLYDYWFVQFDFPNEKGKPYKSAGGKMIWNAELKREIPLGWEVDNIMRLGDLLGGGTPKTNEPSYWGGNIPFFTPKDTDDSIFVLNTMDYITEAGLESCSSRLYPKGTIFITARGTVGNINVAAQDMAMNQSCYAIQPKPEINYYFLHQCSENLVHYLKAKSNGSIFDAIVSNDIKLTPIVIPPLPLIQEFGKITKDMYEKILVNKKESQTLTELRDWLLPMLMNGQVTIK